MSVWLSCGKIQVTNDFPSLFRLKLIAACFLGDKFQTKCWTASAISLHNKRFTKFRKASITLKMNFILLQCSTALGENEYIGLVTSRWNVRFGRPAFLALFTNCYCFGSASIPRRFDFSSTAIGELSKSECHAALWSLQEDRMWCSTVAIMQRN